MVFLRCAGERGWDGKASEVKDDMIVSGCHNTKRRIKKATDWRLNLGMGRM